MREIILLAGPSGSGKSHLSRYPGVTRFRLDDFYLDETAPGLPRLPHGLIDWDNPATWDGPGARDALIELCNTGRADVPDYDIATSSRIGLHEISAPEAAVIVAEGIFAPEMAELLKETGLSVRPIWMHRTRIGNFRRRLKRDLAEKRKPVPVLLRRGVALSRQERAFRKRALAAGFRPMSMRAGRQLLDDLLARA